MILVQRASSGEPPNHWIEAGQVCGVSGSSSSRPSAGHAYGKSIDKKKGTARKHSHFTQIELCAGQLHESAPTPLH